MLTTEDIERLAIVRARLLQIAREASELAVVSGEDLARDVIFLGDVAYIRLRRSGEVNLHFRF